ncbi:MAG: tetratricopeptide repeat protein [Ignavibacteriales bacterium]|nr:MAG: tetratricopeptide repeat protein [Ignavibacteriales bacterium]
MIKTPADLIKEKVKLIFESDRSSPLFTRYANYEIQNNNLDSAVNILNEGLKKFPGHPVAHILLGKVFAGKGNYSEASSHIKTAASILRSDKTREYYLNEFEVFKTQRSVFQSVTKKAFITETPEEKTQTNETVQASPMLDQSLLDTINEITSGGSKGEVKAEQSSGVSQDNLIISETLAKIYLAQGEAQEAINVYSRLMKRNPEKTDYYQKKIDEISGT